MFKTTCEMTILILFHALAVLIFIFLAKYRHVGGGVFRKATNPLLLIGWVYFASAVASLFIGERHLKDFDFSSHKITSYLAFTFLVLLALYPIRLIRGAKSKSYKMHFSERGKVVLWLASLLVWYSVIYQLPYAVRSLYTGASAVRHGLNVEGISVLPESIFTTIAVGVSSFYVLFTLLFFVSIINRQHWFISLSMAVGGLSYVVSSLAFSARDGALFFVLTSIFSFLLFKSELTRQQKRWLLAVGGSIGVAAVFLIGLFTYQRFSGQGSERLIAGTIGYLGQQPYVFSETIEAQTYFYGLNLRFPVLAGLLGSYHEVVRTQPFEWTFGTFIKDYYAMFGWWSALGLTLFGTLVFGYFFGRLNRYGALFSAALIGIYFQLMVSGLFYFRLGTRGGNLFLGLYLVVLVGIYVVSNGSKNAKRARGNA